MVESKYIWMDRKIVDWDKAQTHVLTHTLHYGMGVFEGIRFYKTNKGPAIFRLESHTDRFFDGAKTCFMKLPFTKQEINQAIIDIVKKNKLNSGYIRPIAFYGSGKMGLDPEGAGINVVIAAWPWGSYLGDKAIKIMISSFCRIHPESTHAEAKICGHYVNSIFATREAKQNGFDEALLLDYKGNVAEGPGENIFFVKENKIYTPKTDNILKGITRSTIIEIVKEIGIEVIEKTILPDELKNSDEVFMCGTAAEVTAIGQIDDKIISDGKTGKITEQIKNKYLDIVKGNNSNYKKYLTYCKD